MSTLPFSSLVVGDIGVNCYLVPGPVSGNLYIIDPGDDADDIIHAAREYSCPETVIVLTHAHVDHIGGCGAVAKALGVKNVWLNPPDHPLYASPENHLLPYLPPAKNLPPAVPYGPQQDFIVLETPGHTPGGVCLYFKNIPALFTGDTLFHGSIGRTDLPGGDYDTLLKSIREKILTLPDNLHFYPGHQEPGTIGEEKRSNPYL